MSNNHRNTPMLFHMQTIPQERTQLQNQVTQMKDILHRVRCEMFRFWQVIEEEQSPFLKMQTDLKTTFNTPSALLDNKFNPE